MKKQVVRRIDKRLARRLREARREVGLSTRAVKERLPKRLAVSHATIANYEKGVTVPPVDVLDALAHVYKRPLDWFLSKGSEITEFRYRNLASRVPLSAQRSYAAQAGKWAEAYISLQQHLKQKRIKITVDGASCSPSSLAHVVRKELLDLDDDQPVSNTVTVLESFSAWAIELAASFSFDGAVARLGDEPLVILNPRIDNERTRFNVSRELAYILFANQFDKTLSMLHSSSHVFATCLIMPDTQLIEAFEGRSFLKLIQFKERFGLSLRVMIDRAEELGIINTTASRWLRSEMTKRDWRIKEPGFVWRDRAINFETMLETAIQSKKLTWNEAERVTGVSAELLKERLIEVTQLRPDNS